MSRSYRGCERNEKQDDRHRGEGDGIGWRDAKELRAEESGQGKGTDKAAGQPHRGQRHCLPNDQRDEIG